MAPSVTLWRTSATGSQTNASRLPMGASDAWISVRLRPRNSTGWCSTQPALPTVRTSRGYWAAAPRPSRVRAPT